MKYQDMPKTVPFPVLILVTACSIVLGAVAERLYVNDIAPTTPVQPRIQVEAMIDGKLTTVPLETALNAVKEACEAEPSIIVNEQKVPLGKAVQALADLIGKKEPLAPVE